MWRPSSFPASAMLAGAILTAPAFAFPAGNELELLPSPAEQRATERDARLAKDVERKLAGSPSLVDANIDVEVVDGLARLTGTVPRVDDRRTAKTLAHSVDGVRSVEEDLELVPGVAPDEEEEAE